MFNPTRGREAGKFATSLNYVKPVSKKKKKCRLGVWLSSLVLG